MKKLILSLFVATMFVPVSYAQIMDEATYAKIVKTNDDAFNELLNERLNEQLNEQLKHVSPEQLRVINGLAHCSEFELFKFALDREGVYYSESMHIDFIVEYGVPSCPYGYTKYSTDRKTNHGCETMDVFLSNVNNGYYTLKN